MKKLLIGAALALGLMTGGAQATVYNFTGGNNPTGTGDLASIGCTATGYFNYGCAVTYNADGLGVDGRPDAHPGMIDGIPGSETLTLYFTKAVTVTQFVIGHLNWGDDFQVITDVATHNYGPSGLSNPFALNDLTNFISFRTTGTLYDWRGPDAITLASLTAIAPVPLPASALLLLGALGGLGALRRRRKTA